MRLSLLLALELAWAAPLRAQVRIHVESSAPRSAAVAAKPSAVSPVCLASLPPSLPAANLSAPPLSLDAPIAALRPAAANAAPVSPVKTAAHAPLAAVDAPSARSVSPTPSREFPAASDTALESAVLSHAQSRGFLLSAPEVSGALSSTAQRLSAAAKDKSESEREPPSASVPKTASRRPWPAAIWVLFANLTLTQIGVEALGLAVPQYARDHFGYATLAALSSATAIALAAGSLLGGQASDKLGPERTYVATMAVRAGLIGSLAYLHSHNLMTGPLLVGLFAADYVLHYVSYVALDALAPARLGNDPVRLNRFGFYRQGIIDAVGFGGPLAAGLVVAALGYGAVFWTYMALFLVSSVGGLSILRGARAARARGGDAGISAPASGWLATIREIAKSPTLRWSVIGFALLNVVSLNLYFMIGPAFGAAAAAASGGTAAQITSVMTGLFAGGGILGLSLQSFLTSRLERAAQAVPEAERDAHAARAILRLMGWGMAAAGIAWISFWALLGTVPIASFSLFGLSIPLYLGQLLMLPVGAALTIPWVGLGTILQSRSSAGAKAKTAAVNRFTAMFASFGFSYVLGGLLSGLAGVGAPGLAAFTALAGVLTALGAAAALIGWRLIRAAR